MSNPRADLPAADMTIRENIATLIVAGIVSTSTFDPRNPAMVTQMALALADALIDAINPVAPPAS